MVDKMTERTHAERIEVYEITLVEIDGGCPTHSCASFVDRYCVPVNKLPAYLKSEIEKMAIGTQQSMVLYDLGELLRKIAIESDPTHKIKERIEIKGVSP